MSQNLPRIVIGGTHSGSGKTTVTCALLQALALRGVDAVAAKCGPDFIDPMFHAKVLGTPSRNLDLFFCDENTVNGLLLRHGAGHGLALMEGVMGYYDGVGGTSRQASTYDLARATRSPAVLVMEARGVSLSLAATLRGFADFQKDSDLRGVIFNRCAPALYPLLKRIVEAETELAPLGFLPPLPQAEIKSRHLGLVTAGEIADLQEKLHLLAVQCEQTVEIDGILALARSAPPLTAPPLARPKRVPGAPVIAVARDEAFCFLYEDNLDLLREAGARLAWVSPLHDGGLPAGVSGLLLPGGYPELYAQALSQNALMREAIRRAVLMGMPTLAECGGFLYLHEALCDERGGRYDMAGVIPGAAALRRPMERFGYMTLTAQEDSLLFHKGDSVRGHEFHYWQSDNPGGAFLAEKPSGGASWAAGHGSPGLYAGFPHLYWRSNPGIAENFVAACARYGAGRGAC